ncbi:histone deacetylase [Nocardioides astragali]|uniref:Histone deacetylase n=1 Tax=Nocardioides astragali TaxID=1776736 RepID=A0ABW2N5V8_9ACTN|nr:histone deacetylase [Nocardioides astragali]
MSGTADPRVWYAAFGSNLSTERLACYLRGGVPRGAVREYEGCRDPTPPREHRPITIPGSLRFAGESRVWGGGTAFYTPAGGGVVHARAYLLRLEQFSDLVSQETRHPVGRTLVLAEKGPTRHGLSQVYDVVLDLGELDGHRLVTLSSTRDHRARPPSAAYVRTMLDGLAEGFDLDAEARVAYLAGMAGMSPGWTVDDLRELL